MKAELFIRVKEYLILLTVWTVIFFCTYLIDGNTGVDYRVCWIFLGFPSIGVYIYTTERLIPLIKTNNKGFVDYIMRLFIIGCVFVFSICVLYISMVGYRDNFRPAFLIVSMFVFFQPLIVGPISWLIHAYRESKFEELTGLKTALGQSSANLDFLRSQINPHFLFNALNTLYGTAILENADRTGEGIQKLGDMMRFMLQENVQDRISLIREVDYLNNYIALQQLRTQTSPDISIQTEIDEQLTNLQIAPMLLIPFVENAFKHGISLREPSHIKVTLQTRGTTLFFDVYNSLHTKKDNDPEKDKSGIGLENVKQRLQLLYPQRHELVIRESAKEFFIHLTLQL